MTGAGLGNDKVDGDLTPAPPAWAAAACLRLRVGSPGRAKTLKQNPHWWGAARKPNITTVDFKLFSSTDTEYSTYQTDHDAGLHGHDPRRSRSLPRRVSPTTTSSQP